MNPDQVLMKILSDINEIYFIADIRTKHIVEWTSLITEQNRGGQMKANLRCVSLLRLLCDILRDIYDGLSTVISSVPW